MIPTLIAIDPGATGGIAVLRDGERAIAVKMPETPGDVAQTLKSFCTDPCRVYMERVGGFAGSAQPGSAMFNFGMGYGIIQGVIYTLGVPFELVPPMRWQSAIGLGAKGLARPPKGTVLTKEQKRSFTLMNYRAKKIWKNKLKEVAQRLYPHLKVTLLNADALLILEYARRQEIGYDGRTSENIGFRCRKLVATLKPGLMKDEDEEQEVMPL